jgi:AraC family transcriptional regulator, regulatory protein of adaptative response / methylated-DNA-[protein]-cysteine methyltransferase
MSIQTSTSHYSTIEKAITYLYKHFKEQPSLAEVATFVGLSEYHFQRLFQNWAGVSPKQFLQYVTATYARTLLAECKDALSVAHEAGLSSSSRLHDLMVKVYASTPAELRRQGSNLKLTYGFQDTPFGNCLIALTGRGICHLAFLDDSEPLALQELHALWPHAELTQSQQMTAAYAERIFLSKPTLTELKIHLKGSPFQLKVWEALLEIPLSRLVSYQDIANRIGQPQAYRAVATAIGKNPVAFLIPCHRVIRSSGIIGKYRWGTARKRIILGWEALQQEHTSGIEPS